MFKLKSQKELEGLTQEQQDYYFEQKSAFDKGQREKEISEAIEKKLTEVKESHEEEIKTIKAAQKEAETERAKFLKALEDQGLDISTIKARGDSAAEHIKGKVDHFKKGLDEFAKTEGHSGSILDPKAAGKGSDVIIDLSTKADVLTASFANNRNGFFTGVFTTEAVYPVSLGGLFNQVAYPTGDTQGRIYWAEEDPLVVAANVAAVLEGVAVPESAFGMIMNDAEIKEVGHSIPVSEKVLRYNQAMASHAEAFMWRTLAEKVNGLELNGDEGANAAEFDGVETIAKTNVYPLGVGVNPKFQSIQAPSTRDAIVAAASYSSSFFKYNNEVSATTYCVMNPSDYCLMLLEKDAENRLLLPDFDGTINGISIRQDGRVAVNTLFVGDDKSTYEFFGEGANMAIGWVNNQFNQRLITMRFTQELSMITPNNRQKSLVQIADIAAWKIDSEKP